MKIFILRNTEVDLQRCRPAICSGRPIQKKIRAFLHGFLKTNTMNYIALMNISSPWITFSKFFTSLGFLPE